MGEIIGEKIEFLKEAINDTQNTIRFADSKALAVIGFWTFFFTVVTFRADNLWGLLFSNSSHWGELVFITIILIVMFVQMVVTLYLAYSTLVPNSNPNEHINKGKVAPKGLYFLSGYNLEQPLRWSSLLTDDKELKLKKSLDKYLDELDAMDMRELKLELAYELEKVSFIRSLKMDRVNAAISILKKFIFLVIILSVYFIGRKLFSDFEGGEWIMPLSINVSLFITLYIGHKIADYIFQTDFQALNKSKDWGALFRHCLVYTFIVMVLPYLLLGYFEWISIIIVFLTHIFLDRGNFLKWWAKNIKRIENPNDDSVKIGMFELDQSFHYVILFIISLL